MRARSILKLSPDWQSQIYQADVGGDGAIYSTAIGAQSLVTCGNCMALGGTTDASHTRVGIRNSTPITDLHIVQTDDFAGQKTRGVRLQRRSTADHWNMYIVGVSTLTFEFNDLDAGHWGWISTTGTFVDGSDARSKKNIQPTGSVLNKVLQLQPKKYLFNGQDESNAYSIGLVAQDVKGLFPEIVKEREGGMLGIAYGHVSVLAIKAIQEQQEQIDDLKKTVAELRSVINRLDKESHR